MEKLRVNMDHITVTDDTSWQPEKTDTLIEAIKRLEKELPGWWWTTGACFLTSHASIGPDRYGPDAGLLQYNEFNHGFDADLEQPSTCAEALNDCIDQGLAMKKRLEDDLDIKAATTALDDYNKNGGVSWEELKEELE